MIVQVYKKRNRRNSIKRILSDEQAQGTTEYGLILGFLALVVMLSISVLSDNVISLIEKVGEAVASRTD